MIRVSRRRVIMLVLLLSVLALVSSSQYLMFLGVLGTINAIAVLGLNLISGYTGQLHLGQAAFMGIGAYASSLLVLKCDFSFWLSLVCSIIIAGLFGSLLGIPALKLRGGPYLALVTQTFGELIYVIMLNWVNLTGGPFGLSGIRPPNIGQYTFLGIKRYFVLTLVFLLLSYCAVKRIVKSRFGRAFIAIRESEDAAQAIGINTYKYKTMAFAISAALGGLAGILYAPFIGYISPDQFTWMPSLTLISMAIVGGLTKFEGGLIGAYMLTFLPELLRVADQFRLVLYSLMLILTLAFMPEGVISLFGKSPHKITTIFKERKTNLKEGVKID